METRSRDVHPETRKGPNTTPVLVFHKSAGHDGKLFGKILLAIVVSEARGRGFRPKHSTSLQLALVERVTRNFGEKRLTYAFVLDVAKVSSLVDKLTFLTFPSYLAKYLVLRA
jgi:hypothetical protein